MTISSLTSTSGASQLAFASRLSAAGSVSGVGGGDNATAQAQGRRGPPPPDGGALVSAIADALQSIGVTSTDASQGAASADSEDSATQASGSGNAAQALGGFLHQLMGALHEQGASSAAGGGGQSGGEGYGPPPGMGGPGGPGGPGGAGGGIAADLQSLIAKLGSTDSTDSTDSTSATDSTDETDRTTSITGTSSSSTTTSTDSSTTLESTFQNLLQALGADTDNASGKLATFLQALADRLPGAGSSGNLINTTV